jgi:hypothetical protein
MKNSTWPGLAWPSFQNSISEFSNNSILIEEGDTKYIELIEYERIFFQSTENELFDAKKFTS